MPPPPTADPGGSPPLGNDRERRWSELGSGEFDLLVVGGGITGAGIAQVATARGYRVALVEREDFGGGTSGATSKMLHGGLRYLQQRKVGLVREALHERGRLVRMLGTQRVQSTPFLLPLDGSFGHRLGLRFGTWLYQRLSGDLALGPRKVLSRAEVTQQVPFLSMEGVRGGVLYLEGVVDDVLLTLTRVGQAAHGGALVLNHVEAIAPLLDGSGHLQGVRVRDRRSGREEDVRARKVINAAGVWSSGWAGVDRTPKLRPSKGVHLVFRRKRLPLEVAVVLSAPEGRWVFALPYGPLAIVGTTDTDYPGDPSRIRAEPEDLSYLIEVARRCFPSLDLSLKDVVDVYAGLRPLLDGGAARTNDLSREDVVHEGPGGLLTVAGGKLTTHRAMADRALDVGGLSPRGTSHPAPSPAGAISEEGEPWGSWEFPPLWRGTACPGADLVARALAQESAARASLLRPWVEAGIRVTGASSLGDLMDRRLHTLQRLDPHFEEVVDEVAREAQPLLGWSDAVREREREDYLTRVRFETQAVRSERGDRDAP